MSTRRLLPFFFTRAADEPRAAGAQLYIIWVGPPELGRYDGIGGNNDAARFATCGPGGGLYGGRRGERSLPRREPRHAGRMEVLRRSRVRRPHGRRGLRRALRGLSE